jgi:hypothetical protein
MLEFSSRQRGPVSGERPVRASSNAAGRVTKQQPASNSTKTQLGAGYLEGQGLLNHAQRQRPHSHAAHRGPNSRALYPHRSNGRPLLLLLLLLAAPRSAWCHQPGLFGKHPALDAGCGQATSGGITACLLACLPPHLRRPCCDAADTDRGPPMLHTSDRLPPRPRSLGPPTVKLERGAATMGRRELPEGNHHRCQRGLCLKPINGSACRGKRRA